MKRTQRLFSLFKLRSMVVSGLFLACTQAAVSQSSTAVEEDPTAAIYPQVFKTATHEIVKYQPQIDEWIDFRRLKARMAVSVQKMGSEEAPHYASIQFEADTVADQDERVVHIGPRRVSEVVFVDAKDKAEGEALKKILFSTGNDQTPIKVDLDAMIANVEKSAMMNREVNVNLDPPPIFYADEPSVMLTFMGEPQFKAVDPTKNTILFALNTNWDVLLDVASSTYYLLIEDGWVKTKNLNDGIWWVVDQLPVSFSSLPDDENWKTVRAALHAKPFEKAPRVFVSKQPGELIETEGRPEMTQIAGTKLMYVSNTESDLFFLYTDMNYYYLVEGRWFRSEQLIEGWSAATLDLPAEFSKIPEDHIKADVLASVQGTRFADEAAVMASIPETATVNRADVTLTVVYDGDPQFEEIKGSSGVQYAVNTENDVFLSDGKYYCCYQGVWFVSLSPVGPWEVCDQVDPAIYTIPADSPMHNVTYVQVYNSTPTTVYVGYTSGYTGQYLVRGLLVFGAGYWIANNHHHHHYHWHRASYVGWGCGARYRRHAHGYHRPCRWGYGPHGGPVRATHYRAGKYHRAQHHHGHHRPGHPRPAYNPWKRPAGGGHVGRATPYGAWGSKGVKLDTRVARDRYNKNRVNHVQPVKKPSVRPKVPVGGTPTPRPVARPNTRPSTRPDVYVGKNGSVYKKSPTGSWQQRSGSGWNNAQVVKQPTTRPATGGATKTPTRQTPVRPATPTSTRPTTKPSYNNTRKNNSKLDWDSNSRSRGSSNYSQPRASSSPAPTRSARSRTSRGSSRSSGGSRGGRR